MRHPLRSVLFRRFWAARGAAASTACLSGRGRCCSDSDGAYGTLARCAAALSSLPHGLNSERRRTVLLLAAGYASLGIRFSHVQSVLNSVACIGVRLLRAF